MVVTVRKDLRLVLLILGSSFAIIHKGSQIGSWVAVPTGLHIVGASEFRIILVSNGKGHLRDFTGV